MADNTPQLPTPDPALRRLDRFVGTWSMEGHLVGSDEIAIKGQTTFRWLPGGFFLEQHGTLNFLGMELDSLELIRYDPETETFPSTVYANISPDPLPYRWELEGDTLKISSRTGRWTRPSPAGSTTTARGSVAVGVPTRAPTRRSMCPTTSADVACRSRGGGGSHVRRA